MPNRSRSLSQLPLLPGMLNPLRVSEVAQRVHELLDSDTVLSDVWVQGELSNCVRAASGHLYFSLKDESACIRCVMWKSRGARLIRQPCDGEAILAHGAFSFYEARGDVQLYVEELHYVGAGLLYQQFEALKQRLAAEGLFAEERKRPLPKFPRRIGVVTSLKGAVLQDIRHIIERRFPLPEVVLVPCAVQGDAAAPQIVDALNTLGKVPGIDVIILARGGGSLEDLWPFNDERVARAIVSAPVPVVSGVGHETDFTIADFCADMRAPTPTAAAQYCTPDQNELRRDLIQFEQRLTQEMHSYMAENVRKLATEVVALNRASPRAQIANRRQEVDDLANGCAEQLRRRLDLEREKLHGSIRHLEALSPAATLGRGYALVRRTDDGALVQSASQVRSETKITVRVRDGEFGASVD